MNRRRGQVTERVFGTPDQCIEDGGFSGKFELRPEHRVRAKVKPDSGRILLTLGSLHIDGAAEDIARLTAAVEWAVADLQASVECVECGELHPVPGCRNEELARIERLRAMAYHDVNTGLPNKRFLREAVTQMQAKVGPWGRLAALVLDLDGFKPLNDTYGHAAGDAVLREVARRLTCHAERLATAGIEACPALLGGDEFALVWEVSADPATSFRQVNALGLEVGWALAQPYRGIDLPVSASVGGACRPAHASSMELLRAADEAMYAAKQRGGGMWMEPPAEIGMTLPATPVQG
jgi:diguanylate cyclase (GGDEF)-like protein